MPRTSESATISPGETTSVSLSLGDPRFCNVPEVVLFASASSFIAPTAANKSALRRALARIVRTAPGERLLVVGHTDEVGGVSGPSGNQALSDRRAESALAVLTGNASAWENIFQAEKRAVTQPPWNDDDFRTMLLEVTGTAPSNSTVLEHRELSPAGAARRALLFPQYFEKLLGSPGTTPAVTTLAPPTLGCNELHILGPGDHAPSRRAEFFFFNGASSPVVDCASYPGWLTPCVTPPATRVTVTIDPIDTVRRGRTEQVQVTVNPSPLPLGTTVTLRLETTDGTGDAEFVASGASELVVNTSGPIRIRGVTASSAVDNIRLTAVETGTTTVLASEDFTVVNAVSIFLRFEVWSKVTRSFESVGSGRAVDLMDNDPASDDLITTELTDADGRVFFNLDDIQTASGETDPDLFFLIHLGSEAHGLTLPEEWSTKGWLATDGTPGFHPSFRGSQLGTPSTPLVFRVGLDFHAQLTYHVDAGPRSSSDDPAPKGVLVKLMRVRTGPDLEVASFRTDEDGRVDDVVFDIEPGGTLYLRVVFEMEDADIHLRRARFSTAPGIPIGVDIVTPPFALATFEWDSDESDADQQSFPNHRNTSIGTVTSPATFHCTVGDRNVALHILKVLRELGVVFFELTGGDWEGVEVVVSPTAPVRAFSAPLGRIQIKFPDDRWDRTTILHEMGHQVMWEAVSYSTVGVAYEGLIPGQDLHLFHRSDLLTNPEHALIEGWAEFVASLFENNAHTANFPLGSLVEPPTIPFTTPPTVPGGLGPPPNDRGESVEGAVANGLWAVFDRHVAGLPPAASHRVGESVNGDVTATAPWIRTAAIQERFLRMIWRPLKELAPLSNPTSTRLLAEIKAGAPDDWHALLPELQAFNMAMHQPTATAIEPHWGPVAGGASIGLTVTITGTDFVQRTTASTGAVLETEVDFGGTPGTGVAVGRHTSLEVVPPPLAPPRTAGSVDVTVTTPGGTSTPALEFTYIDDPLDVTDVATEGPGGALNPRVVSTQGDDSFEILGQGFLPGAIVEIDGTQVDPGDVQVQGPDVINILRTPVRPPGDVTVRVVNPPGADSDSLSGRLRFADPPHIITMVQPASRSGPSDQSHEIVILGTNIHSDATVTDGSQSLLVTLSASAAGIEVRFTLPAGPPGLVNFELENPGDGLVARFDFLREEVGP